MPDPTRKQVMGQIEAAVANAHWAGFTEEEVKALFFSALIRKFG